MKCNTMHHLFPLLQLLMIKTLHKLYLRSNPIIFYRPRKQLPEFRYLPKSLINRHIPTLHASIKVCPKIINCLRLH
ncbi:hypothetical protein Hanom_Chr02g00115671 [Helianthus anomalus]